MTTSSLISSLEKCVGGGIVPEPRLCIHTGITSVLPVSIHACRSAAFISINLTLCLPDAALRSAWLREKLTKSPHPSALFIVGSGEWFLVVRPALAQLADPAPLAAKDCVNQSAVSFYPMLI